MSHVIASLRRDSRDDRECAAGCNPDDRHAVLDPTERIAAQMDASAAGAVAFSRTGDPVSGKFEDAVVLARFGEVPADALSER